MFGILFETKEGTQQILVNGQPLTDLFTILTFLMLIITIIVAVKALRETARSNVLSSSPVLMLKYGIDYVSREASIQIQNLGHGAALDIRVDNYYLSYIDNIQYIKGSELMPNKAIHATLKFQPLDLLLDGDIKSLDTSKSKVEGVVDAEGLAYNCMNEKKEMTFHVRYRDISGARYISRTAVLENNIRYSGPARRYNIIQKIRYGIHLLNEHLTLLYRKVEVNHKQDIHNRDSIEEYKMRNLTKG